MKKPLFNSQDRLEMRECDTTIVAIRKAQIAVFHLLRSFHKTINEFLSYFNRKLPEKPFSF